MLADVFLMDLFLQDLTHFVHNKEEYVSLEKFIIQIQILVDVLLVHLMDQEIFASVQFVQLLLLIIVDNTL